MFTRMLAPRRGRGLSLLAVGAVVLLTGTVAPAAPAAAAGGFANAAYQRLWERADQPVAAHQATRSWLWGAGPQTTKQEPYAQGANGTRLVQYFDKARMEINNPSGDPTSPWYVTTGLLVVEMMTGQIQVGDSQFQQAYPATIPIAGDPNDLQQTAPTYAALNPFSGRHLGDNGRLPAGTPITWTLDKNGTFAQTGGRGDLAHIAVYSPDTRHNIADVFWQFMNQTGTVYVNGQYQQGPLMNWIYVMGYPITDPFWTTIRVGGVDHQILVQAFQRRLLTYSPDNPAGWQVEMGNVGQAYYTWRYVQPTCSSVPVRGFGKVWGQHPELASAIGCAQPWQGEQSVQTAVQSFQHGTMLWVARPNTYGYPWAGPSIFVFFDDGTYQRFDDTYVDGQADVCTPTPPSGLVTPTRGFNKIWCEGTGARVRDRLGWATAQESGGSGAWQLFDRGMMIWTGASNQIFALFNIYPSGGSAQTYLQYADTFTGP